MDQNVGIQQFQSFKEKDFNSRILYEVKLSLKNLRKKKDICK